MQGPTGTRDNLVGPHFARVFLVDFDHSATASGIAALPLLLLLLLLLPRLAKASLLLLLMLSDIGDEAARHTLLNGAHFRV